MDFLSMDDPMTRLTVQLTTCEMGASPLLAKGTPVAVGLQLPGVRLAPGTARIHGPEELTFFGSIPGGRRKPRRVSPRSDPWMFTRHERI